MNVLMIGATGSYAHLEVPALKQRNIQICALIRHEDQTDQVRQMGVEDVAIGDLDDPSSLKAAAEGMDGVFHINPAFASDEANMGVNMVHAALGAEDHSGARAPHPASVYPRTSEARTIGIMRCERFVSVKELLTASYEFFDKYRLQYNHATHPFIRPTGPEPDSATR